MNETIRILVVDDQEIVRHGLKHMLESEDDFEVIGDCASAQEATSKAALLHPNIILMDAEMPRMSGIEATRALKRKESSSSGEVIILSESTAYRAEAFEAGATRYILKDTSGRELAQTIKEVYRNSHSAVRHSSNSGRESVELLVPPPAEANQLLRFMYNLSELLHSDDFASIICTVGSWDRDTVIIIRPDSASLLFQLLNIPEVEKVEEVPVRGSFSLNRGFLPRLKPPARKLRVTLKEATLAEGKLMAVN